MSEFGFNLGELLQYRIVPARLNSWRLVRKAMRRGERELHLLSQLADPARTCVDIGANKGVYTHVLSRLCQHVAAFEPHPKVFRMLLRGLPTNASAYQIALSDRDGEAELFIPGRAGRMSTQLGTLQQRSRRPAGSSVFVRTRTLDSFDFRNVGFIKIDVEGFEQAVLRGARTTLERERPVLLLEIEERHTGEPLGTSIASVAGYGYDVYYARDDVDGSAGELCPASGHEGSVPAASVNNFIALPH